MIVAPGSKWFTKQWPVEYFNKVIGEISKDKNIGIAAVGGKEEMLDTSEHRKYCGFKRKNNS